MPDTLQYVILGQALIEGEDLVSIQLFLSWVSNIVSSSFEPLMIGIDDSKAEKGAIKKVWPNAKIAICVWHLMRTVSKHLDYKVHPMNIPFIQKRFEETPDTLVLFDKLSALAQKAILTTNPVICQQSIDQVTEILNQQIKKWWNTKENLKAVQNWWDGFVAKKDKWALSSRIQTEDKVLIHACLQEKSTGRSESFHSTLKKEPHLLKQSDMVQSVIHIVNATLKWNLKYCEKVKSLFFVSEGRCRKFDQNFSFFFETTPKILQEKIREEMQHFLKIVENAEKKDSSSKEVEKAKKTLKKWKSIYPDFDVFSHSCTVVEAFGIPCHHMLGWAHHSQNGWRHLNDPNFWKGKPLILKKISLENSFCIFSS